MMETFSLNSRSRVEGVHDAFAIEEVRCMLLHWLTGMVDVVEADASEK